MRSKSRKDNLRPWTVILLVPAKYSDGVAETITVHTHADTPHVAINIAKSKACNDNDRVFMEDELTCLYCMLGHHNNRLPLDNTWEPNKKEYGSPTNEQRAAAACAAVNQWMMYWNSVGNINDIMIQDCISDLGHLSDREGYDFKEMLERAVNNWEAER